MVVVVVVVVFVVVVVVIVLVVVLVVVVVVVLVLGYTGARGPRQFLYFHMFDRLRPPPCYKLSSLFSHCPQCG